MPKSRDPIHTFVRLRLLYAADQAAKSVGQTLDALSQLRNLADYQIATPGRFATPTATTIAIRDAEDGIAQLDQLQADPIRRAAAIADIKARWP